MFLVRGAMDDHGGLGHYGDNSLIQSVISNKGFITQWIPVDMDMTSFMTDLMVDAKNIHPNGWRNKGSTGRNS